MTNHLSILGIIHTAISILALLVAFFALFKTGKINPVKTTGKLYVWLTVITCLTALPIMKTGHLTAGHPLAIIILLILPIAIYAPSIKLLKKHADDVQTILMSFTLFLSMIPGTIETLTRLPISHPLAADPADPTAKTGLGIVFIFFITGVTYQVIKIRMRKRNVIPATLVK